MIYGPASNPQLVVWNDLSFMRDMPSGWMCTADPMAALLPFVRPVMTYYQANYGLNLVIVERK